MDGSSWESSVRLVGVSDRHRGAAEEFVRERFAAAFGAQVRELMPNLLVSFDEHGKLAACVGYRAAGHSPLFLEQYLDRPIEAELGARFDTTIDRRRIVEIGHFSGLDAGRGRRLIAPLLTHLARNELDWLVFTATRSLRNLFMRLQLQPVPLAAARASSVAAPETWGRYYDDEPWVMGGPLSWSRGLGA